jgi:hypothetical protein
MDDKDDVKIEKTREKINEIANRIGDSLPKMSGSIICARLRLKPRAQWTQEDYNLWNRYGCR